MNLPLILLMWSASLTNPQENVCIKQIDIDPEVTNFIIQTVIKKTSENETKKKLELSYERTYLAYELRDDGQREREINNEVVQIDFGGKENLIMKKGKPVNSTEQKPTGKKFDFISVLNSMVKLSEFDTLKIESINNRPHYVISFRPKKNVKAANDIEEIIIRSEGIIKVDAEKFQITSFDAKMSKLYSKRIVGVPVFTLEKANIKLEQEELWNIMVTRSIIIIIKYSHLFGESYQNWEYKYNKYTYRKIQK
jgi:hypothetical protein